MADTKISQELAASALDGTELTEIVQSGNNRKTTTQDIADLATPLGTIGSGPVVLQSVAPTNTRKAITGTYTVLSSDAGLTLALGGSAFYTVTMPAASGLTAQQVVTLVNEDTGRAKWIAVSGGTNFYLWPGQVATVRNQNNVWIVDRPTRWKLPPGAITFYYDPANGSDTLGVADGLAPWATDHAGPFKTANQLSGFVTDQFDWHTEGDIQTRVTLLNAPGGNDTQNCHFAAHVVPGGQGGAALILDLNGGTMGCTDGSSNTLEVFFGTVLTIQNGTLAAPNAGTASVCALRGAKIAIASGVNFGTLTAGGAHLLLEEDGQIIHSGASSITGSNSSGFLVNNLGGTYVVFPGSSFSISGDVSFDCLLNIDGGYTDISNLAWVDNGHNFNAPAYHIAGAATFNSAPFLGTVRGATQGTWNSWTPFTPSLIVGSGSLTTTTATGLYKQTGNDVDVQYDITLTNIGSASGNIEVSLPTSNGIPAGIWVIAGQEIVVNGKGLVAATGLPASASGYFSIRYADGTVPLADGLRLILSGKYQGVAA